MSKCYERCTLIVTTSLEFSRQGLALTNDQMEAAMIDRINHCGYLIIFKRLTKKMDSSPMADRHSQTSSSGMPCRT